MQMVSRMRRNGFGVVVDELNEAKENARGRKKERITEYIQYLEGNQISLKDVQISENGHILSLGGIEGNVDKLVARRMKGRGRSWRIPGARAMVTLCRYRPQLRDLALRARQIAFVALTGIPFGFTNGQMRFTGTVLALSKNVNFDHMDSPCHLLVVKKARLDCRVNVPCRLLTRLRCTTSASCSLMPDRCPRDTDIKDQLFSC